MEGQGSMSDTHMHERGDAGISTSPYPSHASSHGSPARSANFSPDPLPHQSDARQLSTEDTTPPDVAPTFNKAYLRSYHFGTRLSKFAIAVVAIIVAADAEHFFRVFFNNSINSRVGFLEFTFSIVLIIETFLVVMYLSNLIAMIPLKIRQYLILGLTILLFLCTFISAMVSGEVGIQITLRGQRRDFPAMMAFSVMLLIVYTMDLLFVYSWFTTAKEYAPWPCLCMMDP